uniref:Uncharacterized protein n=1 Tax=Utricularia reniformis TaxID=192314 RepID=A0A1Y0B2Y0_9LAMI|nr:hypothetical protein AEK19_MT1575 [Utricularia reniformis]ART31760.1 hypothetical protein AEK19_MT1575 [Utricularia reniformis]
MDSESLSRTISLQSLYQAIRSAKQIAFSSAQIAFSMPAFRQPITTTNVSPKSAKTSSPRP